jgi:hypothetical protein
MTKLTMVMSGLIFAGVCLQAQAQIIVDIAKVTCDQFVTYKIANPNNIALWLSGYFNGRRGDTLVDTLAMGENNKKLHDYCLTHMQMPLLQAAEIVYGQSEAAGAAPRAGPPSAR